MPAFWPGSPGLTLVVCLEWHQLGRSGTPLTINSFAHPEQGDRRQDGVDVNSQCLIPHTGALLCRAAFHHDRWRWRTEHRLPSGRACHQVMAMHVPPPCSGTGHTGILCSQEAPGPGSGLRTWNLQPRRPSARLQCWGSCRAQPQVWSHTRHAATPGIWVHVCVQSVSFKCAFHLFARADWAPELGFQSP